MTYLFNNQVEYTPRMIDAFTRLRVSSPLTLFEHSNQYGTNAFKWDKSTSGTGTITDTITNTSQSTVLSTGGTASGASAIRQGRSYIHYLAGKSLLLSMTFNLGIGVVGAAKRVGYFDSNNGVFLEQNGTNINFVVRSNSTGSAIDTPIAQANWNVDKLDGTGPSGIVFNANSVQNMRIDLIGLFAIRLYMYFNNVYWLLHEIDNTNITSPSVPSPSTANLSIRQEIVNVAMASATASFNVGNSNVISEGSTEPSPAFIFSSNTGSTTTAVTTRRPLFSIQAKTVGPNSIRNYGQILPVFYDVYSDAALLYEVVLNGTLTGATFTSVNAASLANMDKAATAITGGTVIDSGYVPAGGNKITVNQQEILNLYFPLVYSSLANTQDVLTIVATSISGTANCSASGTWNEFY